MLPAIYGRAKNGLPPPKPHTVSGPDFAQVYLIWEFFLNRTLSGPPVSIESTFARSSLTTGKGLVKVYRIVFCDGLAKVLSMLTGGPDKVRFRKNSQIRYTWAKSGLETVCGLRRREVVFRMAISRGQHAFNKFFSRPGCRAPPAWCEENSGRKWSGWCFLLFPRFCSFSIPSLGKKREGIPFLGLCPIANHEHATKFTWMWRGTPVLLCSSEALGQPG